VGLGEERNEVLQVMDDLRAADIDFLTIGQYLQPSRKHHPVLRFVPPDEFKELAAIAYAKGFSMVAASPLTRSSHHAGDDFARLNPLPAPHRSCLSARPSAMSSIPRPTCSISLPTSHAIPSSSRCAGRCACASARRMQTAGRSSSPT